MLVNPTCRFNEAKGFVEREKRRGGHWFFLWAVMGRASASAIYKVRQSGAQRGGDKANCGSEFIRESGVPGDEDVSNLPAFSRMNSLPQNFLSHRFA
jgi:hypothetical protein